MDNHVPWKKLRCWLVSDDVESKESDKSVVKRVSKKIWKGF